MSNTQQSLPTLFTDNGDLLKKSLLQFPRRYKYDYSRSVKVDLRRVLSFAATYKGEYMKYLFPGVDAACLPRAWQHVLAPERYQHLGSQEFYFSRAHLHDPAHPNRACGAKFKKGELIHRCVTCGKDESSGLCLSCFNEEEHNGHKIVISVCQRENGGVCDCGDEEAWKTKLSCSHHDIEETPESEIPIELKESLFQTFKIVLDYVIDVMSGSTATLVKDKKHDSESILMDSHNSVLDPRQYYGTDWFSEKFYLMLYNDQNRQYRDAIHRITNTTHRVNEFALMVADEVNSVGRAKVTGSTHIEELLEAQAILEATGLPSCIRSARDVFREEMCSEMVQWLIEMTTGPLMGNYNIVRDTLTRALCSKWNIGVKTFPSESVLYPGILNDNKIPTIPSRAKQATSFPETHWASPSKAWNADASATQECDYDLAFSSSQDSPLLHGSRFQYLLYFDIRFWKSFRANIHLLFNSVLTCNRKYRSVVCCQYVDIYPTMLELFLLFDREPEYSCMASLTPQIFTSSSNATMIVEHGDLTRFLAAGYGFLTRMSVLRPGDVIPSVQLSVSSFKNRKIGQVFFDICTVILRTEAYAPVLTTAFMNQICDLLVLFQGKPTLKREALEHVEYENSDYGLYFNMYTVISSLCETVAKVFRLSDLTTASNLIALVLTRILEISHANDNGALKDSTDISKLTMTTVDTIEGPQQIVDFKVHKGTVGFLHPLHSFLTMLMQFSKNRLYENISQYVLNFIDLDKCLLEYPLRTTVLLSQIKAGFWVRNGLSIRTQLHIYLNSGIRESGFKKDIYMLQLMMNWMQPKEFLSTAYYRWGLLPWLKEDFANHDDYDETTLLSMVEEFLLWMMQLLTEPSYLDGTDMIQEMGVKREIIHNLCFQGMSFSKLCSQIPDYLVHEKKFELFLSEVSDYSPPTGSNGAGIYRLKPELMDQVTPYYLHYVPNKREEAESLLKEHMAKLNKIPVSDAYLSPKIPDLEGTLLDSLFRITESRLFVQFLRSTLKFINNEGIDKTDTMLNFTLHLIHIGVSGNDFRYSSKFCENIWSELTADHNEPFYYESVCAIIYKFLREESFRAHHSKIRAIFGALRQKNINADDYLKEQVENYDPSVIGAAPTLKNTESEFDRKKRLAQERKAKIMAKFKAKQNKFVRENEVDGSIADVDMEEDTGSNAWKYPEEHCILCQMTKGPDDYFGVVGNVSQSSGCRTVPFQDKYWTLRSFEDTQNMDEESLVDHNERMVEYFNLIQKKHVIGPPFPSNELDCLKPSLCATSCGHGMHLSCYESYLRSAKARQGQITRTVPEDFEHSEFICPLCKSLGNLFLPILWTYNENRLFDFTEPQESWYDGFDEIASVSCSQPSTIYGFMDHLVQEASVSLKHQYKDLVSQSHIPDTLSKIWISLNSKISSVSLPRYRDHISRMVSQTIKTTEIALRGQEADSGLVVDLLSSQSMMTLRTLTELKKTWFATMAHAELAQGMNKGLSVKMAEENLGKLILLASPRLFEIFEDVDFFDYIVSCNTFGNISNNSLLRMGFMCFIIKSLATILAQLTEVLFEGDVNLFDLSTIKVSQPAAKSILSLSRELRDNHPLFDNLSDDIFETDEFPIVLYTLLTRSVTPFLRQLAIWAVACCADYSDVSFDYDKSEGLESTRLCSFLNLPSIDEMLSLFMANGTVEYEKFTGFVDYVRTTDDDLIFSSLDSPSVVGLVDLPARLDEIFTNVIYKKRSLTDMTTFDPAICLFCGEIMNLQKKAAGSSLGECNFHAKNECLNDVGIFLLPKHSAVLLLSRGNGSFHPAPYVDQHGEHNSDVRQGQVLRLSKARYDYFIRQMWLLHDTKNYITRKLEGVLDIGGWETL